MCTGLRAVRQPRHERRAHGRDHRERLHKSAHSPAASPRPGPGPQPSPTRPLRATSGASAGVAAWCACARKYMLSTRAWGFKRPFICLHALIQSIQSIQSRAGPDPKRFIPAPAWLVAPSPFPMKLSARVSNASLRLMRSMWMALMARRRNSSFCGRCGFVRQLCGGRGGGCGGCGGAVFIAGQVGGCGGCWQLGKATYTELGAKQLTPSWVHAYPSRELVRCRMPRAPRARKGLAVCRAGRPQALAGPQRPTQPTLTSPKSREHAM